MKNFNCSALAITLVSLLAFPQISFAVTKAATPSATPTAVTPIKTPTATPSGDLANQIKNMVKENLDATVSNLEQKINLKSLVGQVGTIKSISSGNLTIESEGNTLQITTSDKTTITKSGTAIKLPALAISDQIIVIGTLIKDDIIQAKAIKVYVEDPDAVVSDAIIAPISVIDLKKKTITLTINTTQVPFTLSKKSTIKLEDLKVGQTIFTITKKYQGKDSLSRAKVLN